MTDRAGRGPEDRRPNSADPEASGVDAADAETDADADAERTTLVHREASGEGESEPLERTVIVDRDAGQAPDGSTLMEDDDEATVVGSGVDPEHDGRTVVSHRETTPDAPTEMAGLRRSTGPIGSATDSRSMARSPLRRAGRRAITLPPAGSAPSRTAVPAPGPHAVASYTPRQVPRPPRVSERPAADASSPRDPHAIPSVARRSRRVAAVATAAVVGSVVVSVVGLITVGALVLG